MAQEKLKKTPVHECHLRLGAKMVPFAGYDMPVQYGRALEETRTVRTHCGLFDVSHMGQVCVRGKNALLAVNRLVTNRVDRLGLGQAQYNMLCNENGGTIDDLVVYRRREDEVFICVNAANRTEDVEWFRSHLPGDVSFEDLSDGTALLALQGPTAEALLSELADPATVRNLKYYWAVDTDVAGHPCLLSRTGYTGEDGFELYVAADRGARLWDLLLEKGKSHGIAPIGLAARDTLRLEAGYPLHGHELGPDISPLSANLGWVVKLDKEEEFPGKSALLREKEQGPARLLRAFVVEDRRIPRTGYPLLNAAGTNVGTISSGTFSPHLDKPIALAFVDREEADAADFFVEIREAKIPARRVNLPFVPSRTKRTVKK